MTAPKSCPVCGGKATVAPTGASGVWVWCDDDGCCTTGPSRPTKAEAIAAWNRLASLPVLVEALTGIQEWSSNAVEFVASVGQGEESEHSADVLVVEHMDAWRKARAALALARGER